MIRENPLKSDKNCIVTQCQTVYALQEFFIGERDDYKVFIDKDRANSEYDTFKACHYRPTRLIERIETVVKMG